MDISKNYFEFIGLPVSYHIDQSELADRARELQKKLHPDRYAHLSEQEQRVAVQYMAYLNEGIATLKAPLKRAQYLLLLNDVDTISEGSTQIEPMFLLQQMEMREKLEDAIDADDPFDVLEELNDEVTQLLQQFRTQFADLFGQDDFNGAASVVRKMQFLEKLILEIERLEDKLDG